MAIPPFPLLMVYSSAQISDLLFVHFNKQQVNNCILCGEIRQPRGRAAWQPPRTPVYRQWYIVDLIDGVGKTDAAGSL